MPLYIILIKIQSKCGTQIDLTLVAVKEIQNNLEDAVFARTILFKEGIISCLDPEISRTIVDFYSNIG